MVIFFKKGNRKYIKNYRPICLLSNTYKLFTKIITTRLEKKLDENQPREQAGFRGKYSTTDHIHAINQHIPYLIPHSHASRSSRHAHTLQHATYQCRTNYFKYSYFPHTIVLWNALPQAVVSSPTLVAFKTSLRMGRMPQNCNLSCVHINLCRITMSGKVSDLPIRFKRAVFT